MGITMSFPSHDKKREFSYLNFQTGHLEPKTLMKLIELETLLDIFSDDVWPGRC
jgi:hypothetical protein